MIDANEILNAKILIVDDQLSNVVLLEQMLGKAGYRYVTSTMNPMDVCSLHLEHQFDLILLDLQMPKMDGFQVMEGIGMIEEDSYPPVLAITAQPAHKLRALNAGAKDFISKPMDAVEFHTRVKNMLEVRLLYKKLESYNEQLEMTVRERTAQLSSSEARFKSFTELTSDWYWEQDGQGKFTTVSGPVFEMLGIAAGANGDATPFIWDELELDVLKHNIANRRPFFDFTYSLQRPDGSNLHLQVSGQPMFDANCRFVGYRGIGVQIGHERHTYRRDANFRRAMDTIAFGVCMANAESLQILDTNEALCRMSGFSRETLLKMTLTELLSLSASQLSSMAKRLIESGDKQQIDPSLDCADGASLPVCAEFHALQQEAEWTLVATFCVQSLSH